MSSIYMQKLIHAQANQTAHFGCPGYVRKSSDSKVKFKYSCHTK